jgi:anti-sigma B factor antagonist
MPEDTQLTLRLERVGDELVVWLGGEMDLSTAPRLRDCFHGQLTEPMHTTRVVIDLEDLDFIDSTGLDALVRARDRVLAYGAELVLRSPSHRVYRLLELTGLDRLFTVEGGIPSA